jgi:hypothetical protein
MTWSLPRPKNDSAAVRVMERCQNFCFEIEIPRKRARFAGISRGMADRPIYSLV